ncbi:hypothetical protein [Streptomyces sp. R41]|uniref:Uncharacterized protein n=1 Tax=Streptomyces sp. R41 TaxID=3238632 RepID=A0AB39RCL6_9ACTN
MHANNASAAAPKLRDLLYLRSLPKGAAALAATATATTTASVAAAPGDAAAASPAPGIAVVGAVIHTLA